MASHPSAFVLLNPHALMLYQSLIAGEVARLSVKLQCLVDPEDIKAIENELETVRGFESRLNDAAQNRIVFDVLGSLDMPTLARNPDFKWIIEQHLKTST